jgi:hypothetical protein
MLGRQSVPGACASIVVSRPNASNKRLQSTSRKIGVFVHISRLEGTANPFAEVSNDLLVTL